MEDVDSVFKRFFDRLRNNRSRTSMATLILEDGTSILDGPSIVKECSHYFGKILSAPPVQSPVKTVATTSILQYVQSMVSVSNANRLEGAFDKAELFYALNQLHNDKKPGYGGLSKEFIECSIGKSCLTGLLP